LKVWKHDDLSEDLALAKGGIPFLNVNLGMAWDYNKYNGYAKHAKRADLVVCLPSYRRFTLSVYEIKVSRSDFLSDIRSEKWKLYLPNCHRFYFATSSDIVKKDDIPDPAGWIIRGENGWSTRKKATKLDNDIDKNVLLSLIFARQRRSSRERRIDLVQDMKSRTYGRRDFNGRLKSCKILGKNLGVLHEISMKLGGIEKATKILTGEYYKNANMGKIDLEFI
jgi:hypothetical protein